MILYGYKYQKYLELRLEIQKERKVIKNYIYIVKFDNLYFINKQDISMLEIEKYSFVGRLFGQDVYVEPFILMQLKEMMKK